MGEFQHGGNEVCVVGCGAVLPQAPNVAALWPRLLVGECLVRPMPAQRWPAECYLVPVSERAHSGDKLYSCHAGWVDDAAIDDLRGKLELPAGADRLRVMAVAATTEALAGVNRTNVAPERTGIFLGCMDQDESFGNLRFMREEEPYLREALGALPADERDRVIEAMIRHFEPVPVGLEHYRAALFPSSILGALRERFDLRGEAELIDAACASSLAAIDQAMHALRAGEIDLAITGGMESNLGPDTFALFCRINALAATRCRPFDRRGDGLNQGEGAVVFALKRLADARAAGDHIWGILRACGSSSDGRSASLFEPTADGQVLALERAYAGLDRGRVAYLECHGTGTRVGDGTELASAQRFFGARELPVGTSKALFGHTKGAAGAVGLIKCLLALRHGVVPPLPDCTSPMLTRGLFVNTEPYPLTHDETGPLYVGVSSFGFGGTNYHLVVERHEPTASVGPAGTTSAAEPMVLCGSVHVAVSEVDLPALSARFHLPPRSFPQIDALQLAALQGTAALLREAVLVEGMLDPARVALVSAGCLGTDASVALGIRVRFHEVFAALRDGGSEYAARLHEVRHHRPDVTEDTGPGMLNNVIAGRVSHAFDFRGCTFNVDADFVSLPVALRRAAGLLRDGTQAVIIISACEGEAADGRALVREGVDCRLVTTRAEALRLGLPLRAIVRADLAKEQLATA